MYAVLDSGTWDMELYHVLALSSLYMLSSAYSKYIWNKEMVCMCSGTVMMQIKGLYNLGMACTSLVMVVWLAMLLYKYSTFDDLLVLCDAIVIHIRSSMSLCCRYKCFTT